MYKLSRCREIYLINDIVSAVQGDGRVEDDDDDFFANDASEEKRRAIAIYLKA